MVCREALEEALNKYAKLFGLTVKSAVVSTGVINFYPDLLKACEANVCRKYNACWTCPPAIEPMQNQIAKIRSYDSALVFTTISGIEDSFDYEGMMKASGDHYRLTSEMHLQFGKTNPVFGAGGCKICEACAYPEPCRFPEKIFSSVEAAGINVTDLSLSGGLRYNNGENTVTFFSMILFNNIGVSGENTAA